MRLAPLAPSPRSETPIVDGFAVRLLVRRKRLKPGTSPQRIIQRQRRRSLQIVTRELDVAERRFSHRRRRARRRNQNLLAGRRGCEHDLHLHRSARAGAPRLLHFLETLRPRPHRSGSLRNVVELECSRCPVDVVAVYDFARNSTPAPATIAPLVSRTTPSTRTPAWPPATCAATNAGAAETASRMPTARYLCLACPLCNRQVHGPWPCRLIFSSLPQPCVRVQSCPARRCARASIMCEPQSFNLSRAVDKTTPFAAS